MTRNTFSILATGLILLSAEIALTGCSGSREDVRVTLCKDMVAVQLGQSQSITWAAVEIRTQGHEDAAIELRYTAHGRGGEAACHFKYNAVDDTALTLSDPLSAYSTSPSEMTLNGQPLPRAVLARTIMDAMAKQGREFVDRAKKAIQ